MTREEAKEMIKHILKVTPKEPPTECDNVEEWRYEDDEIRKALDMAIKALEQEPVYFPPCVDCNTKMNEIREAHDKLKNQEPCVDAVSRAEAIDELNRLGRNAFKDDTDYDNFFAFLDSLSAVAPTRKHGEWEEEVFDLGANLPVRVAYQCSECGNYFDSEFNYCPHCGADMRGGNE